jgi:hypothetical protein
MLPSCPTSTSASSTTAESPHCCGACGIELQDGSPDPCRDAEGCRLRTVNSEGHGQPEVVGVPCGVE